MLQPLIAIQLQKHPEHKIDSPYDGKTDSLPGCRNPAVNLKPSRSVARMHYPWVVFVLTVVWLALFFRLGQMPLVRPDEGRNADIAREMKQSGNWLTPTYNGVDYLDKPAFYFKTVAFSLRIFGNNETAARIPSAVFGLGLLLLTYAFCCRMYSQRCALLAVAVVATMPLFFAQSRIVIFDMELAFFSCGAIFAGYLAEETEGKSRRNWYLLGAAAAGLATLVKGPVGFLIPILVLLIFNRTQHRRGAFRRLFSPLNFMVFFAITLPWFIGVCYVHPDFLRYSFVEECFNRFTSSKFHRSEPFYYYALLMAGTFFPWSLLLPEAAITAWKQRWLKHSTDVLCCVWGIVVVIFFSLSNSKLPGYILTTTVACGILIARLFDAALQNPASRTARVVQRATLVLGILCFALAIALTIGLARLNLLTQMLRLPDEVATTIFHHLPAAAILLAAAAACAATARFRRDTSMAFALLALLPVLFAHVNVPILESVFSARSSRQLAQHILPLSAETQVAFLRCLPHGLPFYLDRTGTLITTDGKELTSNYVLFRVRDQKSCSKGFVSLNDVDQWLNSRKAPVFLIAEKKYLLALEEIAGTRKVLVQQLTPKYFGVLLPARYSL